MMIAPRRAYNVYVDVAGDCLLIHYAVRLGRRGCLSGAFASGERSAEVFVAGSVVQRGEIPVVDIEGILRRRVHDLGFPYD
jgi:hypothetical protein